jgi:hypothetical protein
MVDPPFDDGALQVTVAALLDVTEAETLVGAPGALADET